MEKKTETQEGLQLESMFGPTCEEDVAVTDLEAGTEREGTVNCGEFRYYAFSLYGANKLVTAT